MKFSKVWTFLALAGLSAWACDKKDTPVKEPIPKDDTAETTVLLYMMGENNLSYFVREDLQEVTQGIKDMPENNHLVVFVDDASYPYMIHYEKKNEKTICDTLIRYTEDVCSTDPRILKETLNTVYQRFPSDQYGLILWSHGDGWLPATQKAQTRFIGIDNETNSPSSNIGPQMEIVDLANVLADFPMKFILFDACFMQSAEVAYELRNCAEYLIGSPMEIPGPGAPYHKIMAPMFSPEGIDVHGIAYNYYAYYNPELNGGFSSTYGAAISTICCAEMEKLAKETQLFVRNYAKKEGGITADLLYPYDFRSRQFYYDLGDFVKQTATTDEYNRWKEQWKRVISDCYTTPTVYSAYEGYIRMDSERYHGISMYMPKEEIRYNSYNKAFKQTQWYSAAGWNETGW
ncbi:MAG: hypothetical protein IJ417_06190 [Bacteroidaceae bacterium]|nr:hypothetical protein [Bacteroidaceae bacterium]